MIEKHRTRRADKVICKILETQHRAYADQHVVQDFKKRQRLSIRNQPWMTTMTLGAIGATCGLRLPGLRARP